MPVLIVLLFIVPKTTAGQCPITAAVDGPHTYTTHANTRTPTHTHIYTHRHP